MSGKERSGCVDGGGALGCEGLLKSVSRRCRSAEVNGGEARAKMLRASQENEVGVWMVAAL